ncbi:MAG: hypothetical protein H7832_07990 [Magnetococcus sp. DMHC-6]
MNADPDSIQILQDILLLLGQVSGGQEAIKHRQEEMTRWLDKLESRQRKLEMKMAVFVAGGMSLIHLAEKYLGV